MKRRTKILIGGFGTVLISAVAIVVFLRYQLVKSFPPSDGRLSVPGLLEPVEVRRDDYGVPHIRAENEHDLNFTWGFVHAQDRLWQMDMTRRVGMGTLSEVIGDRTVPFDRMFRILGIGRTAEIVEQAMPDSERQYLQWYANGVNAFIQQADGKLPIEFDVLGYSPEPWHPVHSILIGRLMAWELNMTWWVDPTLGAIAYRSGLEKALELIPSFPGSVPPTVSRDMLRAVKGASSGFVNTMLSFNAFMGKPGLAAGSNAWVIGPQKSRSAGVLIANDAHLQLQVPSKWYEVHVVAPGLNLSGMSVPGAPVVVVGNNSRIGWGITNVMADDADYYIEMLDSTEGNTYLYGGKWIPLTIEREVVRVKGDTTYDVTIRRTRHGPIISDVVTPLKSAALPYVVSMRWTGHDTSNQISCFHSINRSGSWNEFTRALRSFTGPGQNFVYGDVQGNIGYWCALKLPKRGRVNASLPLPGWEKSSEWLGYVPFQHLPHLFNPPAGYIASANNKVVEDSYRYYISTLWEPPSRIQRLHEVLGEDEKFTIEDMSRLQNDMVSRHAMSFTPHIIRILADDSAGHPATETVQEYFRNWNFQYSQEDIASLIFEEFFVQLLHATFRDEMGDQLFHDFLILNNWPIRVITRFVQEDTTSWFDDITTTERETRDDIMRRSMRRALENLSHRLGEDSKNWRWGDVHTLTLQHPFGLVEPLDKLFNIGPYAYKGGPTSVMSGEYSFSNPFATTAGASFRTIVDMSRAGEALRVLPSGQSGQVLHPHYDDQTQLYINGGYRTARMDSIVWSNLAWDLLVLEPEGE